MTFAKAYSKRRRYLFAAVAVLLCGFGAYWINARLLGSGGNQHSLYTPVSLKSLGQFVFDDKSGVDSDIPTEFRALDGKKVCIKGFMFTPNSAASEVPVSQLIWGFGNSHIPPQVQDRVFLHAALGVQMRRYDSTLLITAYGTLHVHVMKDPDGSVYSVYNMAVDDIKSNS